MSKLFGWFSKNKKAEKEKAQQAQELAQQQAQEKAAAEKRAQAEAEAQAKAQAEAEAQAKAQAEAEAQAKAQAEAEAQAKAQAEAEAQAKAQAEAEAQAKAQAEAEAQAKAQAEAEAQAKAQAEAEEKAKAQAEAEAQAKAQAEAEAQAKAQAEAEAQAKAQAEAEAQAKAQAEAEAQAKAQAEAEAQAEPKEKKSLFARLKDSLSRTKENLGSGIVSLFKGKAIDDELYEDLETQLLVADVGMDTTQKIINHLTDSASRKQLKDAEALLDILKQQMAGMLSKVNQPLPEVMQAHDAAEGPFVILMVGVNGVGKTTTIGKLAKQFQQQGKKVMLAAGDTFRAAAVEQLQVWGERNDIPVIAQHTGADSASVLYDALEAAKSRGTDVLIADTAGRLQNKNNLMEELKKVVRVMKKLNPNAPHEVMLTLDAGTGQNAVSQAKLFNEAVGLTGITLTKLDGTAKGGVIFSIADQFNIPIRYIGVGESIDDLRQFDGQEFIDALFSEMETPQS
ncbi:signal recognition particle-docking protein FtsY [Alteromonas sp. 009811495]|uniref:signal recognition particle-docking protein FtsY n=1 Tax=Alteromonas sp. 009811495 TaxID=3002962 RepID=UPI00237D6B2C|nr:signal recognition particle-docking protein FtsY [Alteromonas sp. 009811495]WDT85708.1 signal recognition particle-docking protein FtsY [Alteromonas sp. 009811495]